MDKRTLPRTKEVRLAISESNISRWDKLRMAFFAADPKCIECGDPLDHYSRTMVCRKCQIKEGKKRAKEGQVIYQRKYYAKNKEKIRKRRTIIYQSRMW